MSNFLQEKLRRRSLLQGVQEGHEGCLQAKFPAAQEFSRVLKVIFLLYKHYHATQQCITFQDITVLCSNDYLDMPALTGATGPVIDYGVWTGGTRNIWGNSVLHEELEGEITRLNKNKAALILSPSFQAARSLTRVTTPV